MKGNIEERACQLALYIIENRTTVRAAAQKFGISKSTVHKDLSERLPAFNQPLYLQVKGVLEENKAERHIRGSSSASRFSPVIPARLRPLIPFTPERWLRRRARRPRHGGSWPTPPSSPPAAPAPSG